MMKPVMHLYASKIWNPLKVIFPELIHVTELNITFRKQSLRDWQIESPQFNHTNADHIRS